MLLHIVTKFRDIASGQSITNKSRLTKTENTAGEEQYRNYVANLEHGMLKAVMFLPDNCEEKQMLIKKLTES